MKTTYRTTDEIIKDGTSPLPLSVIPNNMGINLCSVEGMSWQKQDDGQLVSLTIYFVPAASHNAPDKRRYYHPDDFSVS